MKMIEKYRGKKVLVLGLGKSGVNAAKLLKKLGAEVTVNDKNTPSDLTQVNELKNEGIEVITGSHPLELLENIDLMVKNPGIPYTNVLVSGAKDKGIKIITEPELAFEISDARFVGVTGTNGKTTTTTMPLCLLIQSININSNKTINTQYHM